MGATQALGLGQSTVLGLGGDFYPGTRTDGESALYPLLSNSHASASSLHLVCASSEALEFLLSDPATSGIILIGEVGRTMEEDTAAYLLSLPQPPFKPIVGFIAGRGVPSGRSYGHAGAVWNEGVGSAEAKREAWRRGELPCLFALSCCIEQGSLGWACHTAADCVYGLRHAAGIRVVDTVGETAQAIKEEMDAMHCLPAEPDWEKRQAATHSA
jgi:succinyl-CoA synthetase alpha subunit